MQATESPFINAIFDREPLDQFVWGRVALLGEAAHPTTPHGLRRYLCVTCQFCLLLHSFHFFVRWLHGFVHIGRACVFA